VASESNTAIEFMRNVYSKVNSEFIVTDIGSAELIKFVNNSFHALKVAFANEVGRLCKTLNMDSHVLMDLFVKDTMLILHHTTLNQVLLMVARVCLRILKH